MNAVSFQYHPPTILISYPYLSMSSISTEEYHPEPFNKSHFKPLFVLRPPTEC